MRVHERNVTNPYPISSLPGIDWLNTEPVPVFTQHNGQPYRDDTVGWQRPGAKRQKRRKNAHRSAEDSRPPMLQHIQRAVEDTFSPTKKELYKNAYAPLLHDVLGKHRAVDPYLVEAMDTGSWRSIRKFDVGVVDTLLRRN